MIIKLKKPPKLPLFDQLFTEKILQKFVGLVVQAWAGEKYDGRKKDFWRTTSERLIPGQDYFSVSRVNLLGAAKELPNNDLFDVIEEKIPEHTWFSFGPDDVEEMA